MRRIRRRQQVTPGRTAGPKLDLADRNIGAGNLRSALTMTLPLALPGLVASSVGPSQTVKADTNDKFLGGFPRRSIDQVLSSSRRGGSWFTRPVELCGFGYTPRRKRCASGERTGATGKPGLVMIHEHSQFSSIFL